MNCSNLSPSHGQQFSIKCSNMDCSSTGYSCSGTACSSKGLQGHKSHHETCPSMGSSLQTSLPRSCSGPGFPWVHSLKQAPALACGFSKGCRWFCVSHDRPWAVVLQLQQEKLSSSHFTSMLLCPRTSFFFFKYAIIVLCDALSLGQEQVGHGTSWHWLWHIWGRLLAASYKSQPCSPHHQNLATQMQ